jgi:oligopeptide transport system substrate-binding protein
MWRRTSLGVITSLALVLAACGGGASPSAAPASGGDASAAPSQDLAEDQTLIWPGGATDPPTLDPNLASDSASIQVLTSVQRPLLWFTDQLELTTDGGLAESYDISEDAQTITFTLKEGIAFSNGDPITAADFVYSWKRTLDPRTAAPYSYVLADVEGAGDVLAMASADPAPSDNEIEEALDAVGLRAVDDRTFEVSLSRAASYFLYVTTIWVTVPIQESWVEVGEDFTEAENYVASGPFMLDTWSHDEEIILVPNPEWYGEAPLLQQIVITMGADPDGVYRQYLNDEVHIAAVPGANAEQVRADEVLNAQAITGDVLCTYYLGFDMNPEDGDESPVENKALRHAISQAVDREGLIDTVRQGIGRPADSFVPVGMPGHEDYGFGLEFDVEAAQANLATALDELGLSDASEINLTLGVNADAGHEPIMEFIQANLQETLGINVELEAQEWSVYLQTIDENPQDMYRLGWCTDYPHPNNWLYDVWSCDTARGGYCNEEMDELLAEAQVTPELEDQLPLYEQAQTMLVEDAPAVWVYWYGRFTLVKPFVEGLVVTAADSNTGELFMDQVWISNEEDPA